jgi:hypothetical protein
VRPLFGYGTFRRADWRDAIFGAVYPAEPATIAGWRRIATPSGYLSLRETLPHLGSDLVQGVLIELDTVGWAIADAWEEVPIYERRDVEVNSMRGRVAATLYVHGFPDVSIPVDDERLALVDDAEVSAAIDAFAPKMRAIRERLRPPTG